MADQERSSSDAFPIEMPIVQENPDGRGPATSQERSYYFARRWLNYWLHGRGLTVTVEGKVPRMKYRGRIQNDVIEDNTTQTGYVAFRGIPYAAPPTAARRFQPPYPLELNIPFYSTVPVWEAIGDRKPCLQRDRSDNTIGDEDCLYLDLYLPRKPEQIEELLPVLVYFQGGEFSRASDTQRRLSPDSIMKHDLVFVTVNYRLGPFGFLNMQTESCRGNTGLKDQVLALEWIQDNIKRFKGDPNNVTISGHGAGATCVNFHLISPLSTNLFHKAIVSAGGIYCPWGFKGHKSEFQEIFRQASQEDDKEVESCLPGPSSGGAGSSSAAKEEPSTPDDAISEEEKNTLEYKAKELVTECFMRLTCEKLEQISEQILGDYTDDTPTELTTYLGPSIEVVKENAFLPGPISTLMQQAKPVPILAGIAKNEGNQIYQGHSTHDLVKLGRDDKFKSLVMQYFRIDQDKAPEFYEQVKNLYFDTPDKLQPRTIEEILVNMHTDISHRRFYENFQFGEQPDFPEKMYVYEFDYYDDLNKLWREEIHKYQRKEDKVAGHGDELLYLFCPRRFREKLGTLKPEIEHVINNMCSLWANFCKTGTPRSDYENVEWKPHTKAEAHYMHIGKELSLKNGTLNETRWRKYETICKPEPAIPSLEIEPPVPGQPVLFAGLMLEDETPTPLSYTVSPSPSADTPGSVLVPSRKGSIQTPLRFSRTSSLPSPQSPQSPNAPSDGNLPLLQSVMNKLLGKPQYERVSSTDESSHPSSSPTSPMSAASPQAGPSTSRQHRGTPLTARRTGESGSASARPSSPEPRDTTADDTHILDRTVPLVGYRLVRNILDRIQRRSRATLQSPSSV